MSSAELEELPTFRIAMPFHEIDSTTVLRSGYQFERGYEL
jgi:glycine cleavage system aminomethyltransferase T